MAHRADAKAFVGKGYTHHVVYNECAVAGHSSENSAKYDAEERNKKAKELGLEAIYSVAPANEAKMVVNE